MSIWKKALGGIVDFEDNTAPSAVVGAPKVPQFKRGSLHPVVSPITTYDEEMVNTLNKKILSRKTAYTALLETSDKLKRTILDENIRLKAAFDLISSDGRSVQSVLQALDVHLSDLEGEFKRFEQTSESQIKQKSGSLRSEADALTKENESNQQRLSDLQQQQQNLLARMSENSTKIHELGIRANEAEAEIHVVFDRFKQTVEYVKNTLNQTKQNLSNTLS